MLSVCTEAFSKSLLLFSPTQIQVSIDDGRKMVVQNQGGGLGNTIVSVYEQICLCGSEQFFEEWGCHTLGREEPKQLIKIVSLWYNHSALGKNIFVKFYSRHEEFLSLIQTMLLKGEPLLSWVIMRQVLSLSAARSFKKSLVKRLFRSEWSGCYFFIIPDEDFAELPQFLHFYLINWPINIIVHGSAVAQGNPDNFLASANYHEFNYDKKKPGKIQSQNIAVVLCMALSKIRQDSRSLALLCP